MKIRLTNYHSYDIIFNKTLRKITEDILNHDSGNLHFVITDSNVAKLYGKNFVKMLRNKGSNSHLLIIPAGEKSKSRKVKEIIEDKILAYQAHRDSLIIALGGGMIGDIAGLVASTLHRGMPYIQIPTTLLAQVDSSVGGKVAVNHPIGKNLIGAFYKPKKV
jgi:3-dehydroquinate synthase